MLCLSGSTMYWLPWFSDVFYVPMRTSFGFSNTEIGMLISAFGIASFIGYIPGGWLADRFSPRKLICIALLMTSAGGFVFVTIPTFEVSLVLYSSWGVAAGLVFWAAFIKAARSWGRSDEQGRAFGILEGGRNVTDSVSATVLLAIFAFLGSGLDALRDVLILHAVAPLVLAIVVWIMLKEDPRPDDTPGEGGSVMSLADAKELVKMPTLWLLAIIILAAYSGYWGSVYFTSYATDAYGLGEVFGGSISVAKYWIAPVAAVVAGLIADKVGAAKAVVGSFVIMTGGFLTFGFVPGAPTLVPFLLVNASIIAVAVFALRGIYFALLEQGRIPIALTGTATGLVSLIGFTPDIFVPPMAGIVIDAYPGAAGYQVLFLIIGGLCFIGLLAAIGVYRTVQAVPSVDAAECD